MQAYLKGAASRHVPFIDWALVFGANALARDCARRRSRRLCSKACISLDSRHCRPDIRTRLCCPMGQNIESSPVALGCESSRIHTETVNHGKHVAPLDWLSLI